MTWAPPSARTCPAHGTAMKWPNSSTVTPANGCSVTRSPGERVGRTARIGAGRQHPGGRIATRDHRADAARADLRHRVTERAQLGARALGNAGLDVELAGLVDARVERAHERLGREARGLDGLLRIHAEGHQIQHELQIGLRLIVTTRASDGHHRRTVLAD